MARKAQRRETRATSGGRGIENLLRWDNTVAALAQSVNKITTYDPRQVDHLKTVRTAIRQACAPRVPESTRERALTLLEKFDSAVLRLGYRPWWRNER